MMADRVGPAVGASNPELIAHPLLPERYTDWPALLDDDTGFRFAVDCQDAHRNLIDAWDPDHCELAGVGVVEAYVAEPEGTDRRCLFLDPFQVNYPGRM